MSDSAHSVYGKYIGTITLPPGDTYLNTPVSWHGLADVTIKGDPSGTSCLVLIGNGPLDAFLDIRGANNCTFKNFNIRITRPGVYAAIMISSLPHAGNHGRSCSQCTFENIRIENPGDAVPSEVCVSVGPKTLYEADGNNDLHTFRNIRATNYNRAAFRINGSQCHSLLFQECAATGYGGRSDYAWDWEFGCFAKAERCFANSSRLADIRMAGSASKLVVDDFNSELSNAVFASAGNGGGPFGVEIRDSRWSLRKRPDSAEPAIAFNYPGPLAVVNSLIEEIGNNVPEIVMGNPGSVLRLERTSFYTRGPVSGRAVVRGWPDLDAKSDACTVTRVTDGEWEFFKVPSDPTKAMKQAGGV